jgi:hypothetical protein
MNRLGKVAAVAIALSGTPALADWGTVTDAKVCADLAKWGGPECQGEITKRIKVCLADGDMATDLAQLGYSGGDNVPAEATKLCKKEATKEIQKQLATVSRDKVEVDKKAKEEAEAVKTRELPKATWKNPGIEKMVSTAFNRDWKPEGQTLMKVILDSESTKDWTVERGPLGQLVSRYIHATAVFKKGDRCTMHSGNWEQKHNGKGFAGELQEHGMDRDEELLCAKVK